MARETKGKKYLFEYNLSFVNIISIVILLIMVVLTYVLELTFGLGFFDEYGLLLFDVSKTDSNMVFIGTMILSCIIMILWFVLHEIIHGVAYCLCGVKKENITFGVVLEKGILYCRCNEFVNKKTILISCIAPFVVIGVITYALGVIFNFGFLVLLSIFNICGAAGDLAMFGFFLGRRNDVKFRELDDSTTFCLETKEDLVNNIFMAVKLKKVINNKELNELKDDKTKFINVSKFSWGFIIVMLVLMIVSLVMMFI